jgi:ProP effector
LRHYCNSTPYLHRLREGASRIDLSGQPAGVVTASEEADAKARLAAIAAKRARRRAKAATTGAAPPAPTAPAPRGGSLADLRAAAAARRRREAEGAAT